MNTYRVVFTYGSRERDVELEAPSADRAAVDALLKGLLPAFFIGGEAIYWSPKFAGADRWPVVVEPGIIAWGDPDNTRTVVYSVEESSSDSEEAET